MPEPGADLARGPHAGSLAAAKGRKKLLDAFLAAIFAF